MRALGKSRQTFGACNGLTGAVEVKAARERIPVPRLDRLQALLTAFLRAEYLPPRWEDAQFHVPYFIKGVTEVRGGARAFVRYETLHSPQTDELKESDEIQGQWTVGNIEVLPHTSFGPDAERGALIRLRLHGDQRLSFRERQDKGSHSRDLADFFDPVAFQERLRKVFRVPFENPDQIVLDGYDVKYEGVGVFHGNIRSRDWHVARDIPNTNQTAPHWWDEMRLLVTDSDPQYFCVSIVLGPNDVIPPAQP